MGLCRGKDAEVGNKKQKRFAEDKKDKRYQRSYTNMKSIGY
jgi:hypothetical protein